MAPQTRVSKYTRSKEDPMEVRDPVCGMRFDEPGAVATVQYRGTTQYFCSEHCKTAFEKDPERYLERSRPESGT
jgi:YHS domain-containing protein